MSNIDMRLDLVFCCNSVTNASEEDIEVEAFRSVNIVSFLYIVAKIQAENCRTVQIFSNLNQYSSKNNESTRIGRSS